MDINVTEVLRKHKKWLDGDSEGERADLTGANLYGVNLTGVNLTGVNLTGAVLDFAAWPLWCGSFGVKVDARLVWQLVAHIARVVPPDGDADIDALMAAIRPWVNKFCAYQNDVKNI